MPARARLALVPVLLAVVLAPPPAAAAGQAAAASPTGGGTLRLATWGCYVDPVRPDKPLGWEEFEGATGAEVVVSIVGTGAEVVAAAAAGGADVVVGSSDVVPVMMARGTIVPIPVARLKNYRDLLPGLQHVRYGLADERDHCVPLAWGEFGLAYDTAVFPEPPRTWRVLWEPAWAGRVAHWDDVAVLWTAALASGQRDCFGLSGQSLWEAGRWAARLCAQAGLLWRDEESQVAAMAAGRVVLNATWASTVAQANRVAGRRSGTWAMVRPDEGCTAFVDNLCVTSACRDPRLALAFIDFAISPGQQVALSDRSDFGPASAAAAGRLSAARRARLHLDDPNHLNRLILWRPPAEPAEYERIWQEARSRRILQ